MSKFRERFKQLKTELNLSNNKLAKIIGVSSSTIAKWEKGLTKPKITKFYNLCMLFNVTADYLLGFKDVLNRKSR